MLCDFGLIRLDCEEGPTGTTTTSGYSGTNRYLARELLVDPEALPSTASDIHALGCVGMEVSNHV